MLEKTEATLDPTLAAAFEALGRYDWGSDRGALQPIEETLRASPADPATRKEVESRLADLLGGQAPAAAKGFVCRTLSRIGTSRSVPALAALLGVPELSHMARYALERIGIDSPQAVRALRDALSDSEEILLVGVIHSLGALRDAAAVSRLAALLDGKKAAVVRAALAALGEIGTEDAAAALGGFRDRAPGDYRLAAADALLTCAERLVASGRRTEAERIYLAVRSGEYPEHARTAAARGIETSKETRGGHEG